MFGNTENVLRTLKNPSSIKETQTIDKKSNYVSIFEAIDKMTVKVEEGQLIDPSKDDIATQQKKLTEMSVKEAPEDLEDKEGYNYLGSSAQENFYYKADYDMESKKLMSIQVLNSVDEEVANITNEMDEKSAKMISNIVDQLKLDSISFKMLVDVGAIDLEPDAITPADGAEGGGSGGPGSSTAGGGTGAAADAELGDQGNSIDVNGGQPGGGTDPDVGAEEDDDEKKKFIVGSKENIKAIPVPWSKTIKETSNLLESKEKATAAKVKLSEGRYKIIERGKKLSLVAKILGENIVSSKTRFLITNEALDVQITPSGVSIKIDDGQPAAVEPAALPAAPIDQGNVEPIEILTDDMPEVGEGDYEADDEVDLPESKDKKIGGFYKVIEKTAKGYKLRKMAEGENKRAYKVCDDGGQCHSQVTGKNTARRDVRRLKKQYPDAKFSISRDTKKHNKESKLKETKQIIKGWSESTSGWVTDPVALRQLLEAPNPSESTVVVFVENGRNGSELVSNLQGESVDVGQVIVKIPVAGAAQPAMDANLPPKPITPSDAAMPEAKIPDVVNKTGQEVINDLLEKHGIKEAETTPASREDAGGSASISKEGEGDLKMTGGINLDDKGGPSNSKTSTPASKEDDGGTASISKEGEGKLDQGDINRKDGDPGFTSAASGAAGASADKGPISNSGGEGSTDGGPQGAADSNKSTSTLESAQKNLLEYIAKLEKEMNEEKVPEVKQTIAETITWLKSKVKKTK